MKIILTENEEVNEEIIEEEVEVEEVSPSDIRLQKSINVLKKLTKVDEEKLKGLTLEEQFDRLEFLADNMPKTSKRKNKPVIALPTDVDAPKLGRKVSDSTGSGFMLFKPSEWLKKKRIK